MRALAPLVFGLPLVLACDAAPAQSPDAGAPFVAKTLSFSTGDFVSPPGVEITRCIYLPLGHEADALVGGYHARMLAGSHHFNMFFAEPTNPSVTGKPRGELTDCDSGWKSYLAGSQWRELDEVMPEGIAIRIPAGSIIVLEAHYVNTTDGAVPARVEVELDLVDPAKLTDELGVYFNMLSDVRVEPGERVKLSGRCPTDADVKLAVLTSHMHHYGERFEINLISADGVSSPLYTNDDYSHPSVLELWDAPIVLPAGSELEWSCLYSNQTDRAVIGGGSAETEEMCMMAAFYYPRKTSQLYCTDDAARSTP